MVATPHGLKVLCFYVHGLKYAEIGKYFGISGEAIYKYLKNMTMVNYLHSSKELIVLYSEWEYEMNFKAQ